MAINKEWHLSHKMPENATFQERIEWHLEHVKHCNCAPIPKKLLQEMKDKGIALEN